MYGVKILNEICYKKSQQTFNNDLDCYLEVRKITFRRYFLKTTKRDFLKMSKNRINGPSMLVECFGFNDQNAWIFR